MEKTIKALENFKKAYLELIDEFDNLNELDSIRFYPFQRSFDEYNKEIVVLINKTIKELRDKNN